MANETEYPKLSFEQRVDTQLSSVTSIRWSGIDFDTDSALEWIEPAFLGLSPAASRKSARSELWTWQFNCFAKIGEGGKSTTRVHQLVDAVRAAFHQHDLAVNDWSGGSPGAVLYHIRLDEMQTIPIPSSTQLQQINVTVSGWIHT